MGVNITITVTGCRARLALVNWVNSELLARLRVRFTRDLFGSPRMRNRTTNDCEIAAVKKRDTGECLSRFTRRLLHNVLFKLNIYSLRVYNRSNTREEFYNNGYLFRSTIGLALRVEYKHTPANSSNIGPIFSKISLMSLA